LFIANAGSDGSLKLLEGDGFDQPGDEAGAAIEFLVAKSGDGDARQVVHLAKVQHHGRAAAIGQADVGDDQIEWMSRGEGQSALDARCAFHVVLEALKQPAHDVLRVNVVFDEEDPERPSHQDHHLCVAKSFRAQDGTGKRNGGSLGARMIKFNLQRAG